MGGRWVLFLCAWLAVGLVVSVKSTRIAYAVYGEDRSGYARDVQVRELDRDFADSEVAGVLNSTFAQENVTCVGVFNNTINSTGWSTLELRTKESVPSFVQARSAGLVEGQLTADLIYLSYTNMIEQYCNNITETCTKIEKFLKKNREYVESQWLKHRTDSYWQHVHLYYIQQNGISEILKQKYPQVPNNSIEWLNAQPEIDDLVDILRSSNDTLTSRRRSYAGSGSCSAIIKVTQNASDILFSHTTWTTYESMLRVLKRYTLPYRVSPRNEPEGDIIPGKDASFSSYPGLLVSVDDYYVISSGLATMETTIGNENETLWKYVKPTTVLEGVRTVVANRLANSGKKWVRIFGKHNSGTYNNQWMILDYKIFRKTQGQGVAQLQRDLLWVTEQIPGYIVSQDLTDVLKNKTYWSSYNLPYFPKINQLSGNADLAEKNGAWYTFEGCPRALMFKRDHDKVVNETSALKLLRYNDFLNDPLSDCPECIPRRNAQNAIACRSDLNPPNGTYPWPALSYRDHGAIDAKVTSNKMALDLRSLTESGPTRYSPSCPPFSWATTGFAKTTPHNGLPILWEFDPIIHEWQFPVITEGGEKGKRKKKGKREKEKGEEWQNETVNEREQESDERERLESTSKDDTDEVRDESMSREH